MPAPLPPNLIAARLALNDIQALERYVAAAKMHIEKGEPAQGVTAETYCTQLGDRHQALILDIDRMLNPPPAQPPQSPAERSAIF